MKEHLIRLINEIAQIPIDRITDAAAVDGELRMESVTFVELYVAIEDEFQVELDPLAVLELNQFAAIAEYIYTRIVAK